MWPASDTAPSTSCCPEPRRPRLRDQGAVAYEVHDRQPEAEIREAVARDREARRRAHEVDRVRGDGADARGDTGDDNGDAPAVGGEGHIGRVDSGRRRTEP